MTASGADREGSHRLALTLANDLHELRRVSPHVEQFLSEAGATPWAADSVRLVIEELASNTIRHAWPDSARHSFHMTLSRAGRDAVIECDDDGREFDPLSFSPREPNLPLELRNGSGLGIHLVRSVAKHIEYRRDAGRNRLRVTLDLGASGR